MLIERVTRSYIHVFGCLNDDLTFKTEMDSYVNMDFVTSFGFLEYGGKQCIILTVNNIKEMFISDDYDYFCGLI